MFGLLLGMLMLGAVPPLSPQQVERVLSAADFEANWDEPALYPLMENALTWEALDEAGAMIPDYPALTASPAEYRGRLFVVTGQLGGPPEVIQRRLSRPGAWDGKLQRYGILTSVNPDHVVVVYLVDPPPPDQTPRTAAHLRILCRFFKVWRFADLDGQPTDYLVFVGRTVSGNPRTAVDRSVERTIPAVLLILLLAAGALFWMLRRGSRLSLEPRPLARQVLRRQQAREKDAAPTPEVDPADALAKLASEQDGRGQGES